jgi:hypothetical protein
VPSTSRSPSAWWRTPADPVRRRRDVVQLAAAAASVLVAALLFSRFGINGSLSRDEAIYVYGGQQMAHGVAPYDSIFDPKGPIATVVAGMAAVVARLSGRDDLMLIRFTFFVLSCLTVLAVHLLGTRLWRSWAAGLVGAVVFASFRGFAADALSGPDAKTPGILLAVLSMWLLLGRRWFWAAATGSLAALVWQPLLFYPLVVLLVALLGPPAGRRRSARVSVVAGGLAPVLLTVVYFASAGALGRFLEATVAYPMTGVVRPHESVPSRLLRVVEVVNRYYDASAVLFWVGIVLLVALVVGRLVGGRGDLIGTLRDPLVCVVGVTLAAEVAYAATDFQGYPDVYPFLVYAALGFGGAVPLVAARLTTLRARRFAAGSAAVATVALVAASAVSFSRDPWHNDGLLDQRADACALARIAIPGRPLYSLGEPTPLVLAHRRNPDRFVFLEAGVDQWKVDHTKGGFDGWTRQIAAAGPSVVVVAGWHKEMTLQMHAWLTGHGLRRTFVGPWRTFVEPAADERAARRGIALPGRETPVVTDPSGRPLDATPCERRAR